MIKIFAGLAALMIVGSWVMTIGDMYRKILQVERELKQAQGKRR